MKYMLLMMAPNDGYKEMSKMSPAEIGAHIDFMHVLNADLKTRGELVDAQGLDMPNNGKIVRAAADGTPAVTDGPFPESKEFLAGYWLVDVASEPRVLELAAFISTAPGVGGKPMRFPVEVRRVPPPPPGHATP
ncbi:MAG: hypothetical protein IAG13_09610 [Deltaproteobacteria bacterium]|nr:hypothetical protein [Nannocystaceae bacterium]